MMGENIETPQSAESPDSGSDAERPESPQPDEVSAEISKDARNMAMLCHLLAIFTGFVAPLIIWLLKKSEEPYVDQQGKEALNFQITIILAMFAAVLLSFICIGVPLLFAIPIVNLIFCIIASIKASNGVAYRYPVSLRLIK
ncbi:MAG: DUF4870 domain-containing protein [Planctomycetota bacterium]|jgi:uncharacterized Tic20 family protein